MTRTLTTSLFTLAFALTFTLAAGPALAGGELPDPCAKLSADDMATAKQVMTKVYPHDCCDDTLANCLKAPSPSKLVKRLRGRVCVGVAEGKKEADIVRGLERRGASMLSADKSAEMDLASVEWAGEADAPVPVVAYVCARCPFCAKLIPSLHACVTGALLQGNARLGVRIFPIRGHKGGAEGGIAMQAALAQGKFWPMLLQLYNDFDGFAVDKLGDFAAAAGLDGATFGAAMKDKAVRKKVVASKKEGLRLGVEATPTFFINGKRYKGDFGPGDLQDAILEEKERMEGTLCKP